MGVVCSRKYIQNLSHCILFIVFFCFDLKFITHRKRINEKYVKNTGYITTAESNNIIVMFPQLVSTLTNPGRCWDWWGYTNKNFRKQAFFLAFMF